MQLSTTALDAVTAGTGGSPPIWPLGASLLVVVLISVAVWLSTRSAAARSRRSAADRPSGRSRQVQPTGRSRQVQPTGPDAADAAQAAGETDRADPS